MFIERKERLSKEALNPVEEAAALYREFIEKPEIAEALVLLDKLPEHLRYHGKAHTLDVIQETILFAVADGASRKVIEQQAISAAWHDTGYITQDKENEPIAVKLFEQSRAYKTLPVEKRNEVIANILDTQVLMKEGAPFLLQQRSEFGYILDGDVSNFGREDFFEKRMRVAEELKLDLADLEAKKKFYEFSIDLLKNHEWKTNSARALRQAQKERNLKQAEEEYEELLRLNK